jgi:hypothetical protein
VGNLAGSLLSAGLWTNRKSRLKGRLPPGMATLQERIELV